MDDFGLGFHSSGEPIGAGLLAMLSSHPDVFAERFAGLEPIPIRVPGLIRLPEAGQESAALVAHLAEHGYPPPHKFARLFPRITAAGHEALAESIRQNGIREPVTVFDNQIVDGIARCVAAIALGIPWEQLPKADFDGDETALLDFVIDQNVTRRHLDESQRAMMAARMANMRQGERTDLRQICRMSQEQAAQRLNVGSRTLRHAVVVLDRGVPELQDAVDRGVLAASAASAGATLPVDQQRAMVARALAQTKPAKAFGAEIRKAEIESRHRQIVANARRHDLALKRYHIILVDYPWEGNVSRRGSPFPRISIPDLCQFRVDDRRLIRDVVAEDAIMFFWIPDIHIFELPKIAEAWGGFKPRISMQWPKSTLGIGHYVRPQHETVWVCTRGNFAPPPEHLRPSSLIVGPRLDGGGGFCFASAHDSRHSSKPDSLCEGIERSYPEYFGPETVATPHALELFARSYRPRWDGQGFEYPGRPEAA